jgi:hypothetical protein
MNHLSQVKQGEIDMTLSISNEEKIVRKHIYQTWIDIKKRCLNPNHKQFKDWGGRGISICDNWLIFENFHLDMKKTWSFEKNSIDRIDNDGNYEPSNCQWLSRSENVKKRNINSIKNKTHHFLNSMENGTNPSCIMVSCIYCKRILRLGNFFRWHGIKCKENCHQH